MQVEGKDQSRRDWRRWASVLAILAFVAGLAILLFPWGASAYYVERAGQKLDASRPGDTSWSGGAVLSDLERALDWHPGNARAYHLRAQVYDLRGDRVAQVESLARYTELRPEDPLGNWELAMACEKLGAAQLGLVPSQPCGHDEESRKESLCHLWRLAGQSAADLIRAGDSFRRSQDWPEATAFYQRALLLDPETAAAWYGLGQVYLAGGKAKAALEAFGWVVDLGSDPQLVASAHDQRGQILAGFQRWAEAREELAQAVALVPDNGVYHLRYGRYLHRSGESMQLARAELELAADMLPDSPWPRLRLAELDQTEEEYSQMLMHAEQATELQPGLVSAWVLLGRALRFLEQFEEAERIHRHAIELAPDNATAHAELARVLERMDLLDEAIVEFERAVSLAPKNIGHLLTLGNAYRANGQTAQAVKTYQRVLEIDPDNLTASQALEDLGY